MGCADSSKAQAGIEYMVIVGAIIFMSAIVFFYSLIYSNNSLSISKASESAEAVAEAIDYAYSLGQGTQTVVTIDLPGNVESASVGDYEVVFVLVTNTGKNEVIASTTTDASGTLPTGEGLHQILVNNTGTGVVVG